MKMKRSFFIILMVLISAFSLDAQRIIKGTVTEADSKEPLIGATVVVVGDESIGTITDLDGNYTLDVPVDAKRLQVTYVGYNKMIADITGNSVNFALTTGVMIDEVVVVGYGTMKTKEVTSAVTNVNAADFNKGNINNATQLLQGKVAGLSIAKPGGDPNAGFNIRLRGISTFGSNTQPLLVVDGIIVDNFDAIDPNDVESFSVLKDASAAAIYGTRASNGVLLIKTKSGVKDNKNRIQWPGLIRPDVKPSGCFDCI
jgi:iron complex outermembrane receptor protein